MEQTNRPGLPDEFEEQLAAAARGLANVVIGHRRALHEIPELAFEERLTRMSREAIRNRWLKPQAVYGYFPANGAGDDPNRPVVGLATRRRLASGERPRADCARAA